MKFEQFITHVDNLVREWVCDEPHAGAVPREQLRAIYDDVREQAVHDLAETVRVRDRATRTHGMLIITDRKQQAKGTTLDESQPRHTLD
jgi:hypothetical protein